MSPVERPLSGASLSFSLAREIQTVRDELSPARERIARTLVKEGPLRVTLVGLNAGGTLRAHKADGPISVHVLEGAIELTAGDTATPLGAGELFVLGPGITHSVASAAGGMFLLTVVALENEPRSPE